MENHNKHIDWQVEGMTCGGCVQKVRKQLERKGAGDIFIDLASGEVSFSLEKDSLSKVNLLKKAIHSLGFRVISENEDRGYDRLKIKLFISAVFTLPLLLGHLFMMTPFEVPQLLTDRFFQLILCIPVYLIGVQHFGTSALGALKNRTTNMDVLIFIGTTAAFFYSLTGTILDEPNYLFYETAATIITLVLTGNFIEKRAIRSTTSSIEDLIKLQQVTAIKLNPDGSSSQIAASEIKTGDLLFVNDGDQVPCDGIIEEGSASFDESLLTGESLPIFKKEGDELFGASIAVNGNVLIKATATGGDSFLGKLIKLVKSAQNSKSGMQILADKISSVFVPVVLIIAGLTFVLSWFVVAIPLQNAIMNSVAVLVIACPCAMGLATPTAVMVGVGRAAKLGILPRRGDSFERLVGIKYLVFDKTGTLTHGTFSLKSIEFEPNLESEAKSVIYQLEQRSNHPLAKAILKHFTAEGWIDDRIKLQSIKEIPGFGLEARDDAGNSYQITGKDHDQKGTHLISLTKNNEEIARIELTDQIKDQAAEVIQYFRDQEIETIILSGDREGPTREVASALQIHHNYPLHNPQQKLDVIEKYTKKGITAMVGDGINDSGALARADIGIAFSSTATLAMQSADLVLLNDRLESVIKSHQLSKLTVTTIKQNLFWAFSYNIVAIPMAALGFLNPMAAAFFMAFSDLVVIGNSVRLKWKKL